MSRAAITITPSPYSGLRIFLDNGEKYQGVGYSDFQISEVFTPSALTTAIVNGFEFNGFITDDEHRHAIESAIRARREYLKTTKAL